ncbi:hypothetical protein BIW11_08537 [Tropilaelaps mercedesae]|uniref:Uncharacterized protein n=1 Tax=Tropilaelaps mercedesae TaxID=418985 RepID=A0A1V9XP52_9ACAR|nr:hypothetical protein BIW11_08537 [Tropilaelaps mercedesae]
MFLPDVTPLILFACVNQLCLGCIPASERKARLQNQISDLLNTFLKVPPIISTQLAKSLADELYLGRRKLPESVSILEYVSEPRRDALNGREAPQNSSNYMPSSPAQFNIFELPGVALLKFLAGMKNSAKRHDTVAQSAIHSFLETTPEANASMVTHSKEYERMLGEVRKILKGNIPAQEVLVVSAVDRDAVLRALFILIGVCLFTSLFLVFLIMCTSAVSRCRSRYTIRRQSCRP